MKEFNKNNPFKTPEGYLQRFTARLMEKVSQKESDLSQLKKDRGGFIVPNDYFENLNRKIVIKTPLGETKVVQLHPSDNYRNRRYILAAASVAAILLLVFVLRWDNTHVPTFTDLTSSDIENYFDANDLDLNTYDIAEVIPVDELEINDILQNQLNQENVLDYLDNNIDDFEELNLDDNE